MKKIIIHIGGHKTGSTAIQKFLFLNKELLKKSGWLFPGPVHAHNTIGTELLKNKGYEDTININTFLEKSPFTKKIIDEIVTSDKNRVIISAEFFEYFPKKAIENIKSALDGVTGGEKEYSIIYYCRRQDTLVESLYREAIKQDFLDGNKSHGSFEKFKSGCPIRDYAEIAGAWAEVFGKDHVIVQPYEKEQMDKDIFSDFFRKIDLEITDGYQYPPNEISNIGLSADLTEYLRLLSESANIDRRFRYRLYRILITLNIKDNGTHAKKNSYFSPKERWDLLSRCEEGNQKVAREYLGRTDGKLFYEPWPDLDEPWEPYKGIAVESAVLIISQLLFNLEKERKAAVSSKEIGVKKVFRSLKRHLHRMKNRFTL